MIPETETDREDTKLVVISGGTGGYAALQSLKELTPDITSLVSMADDGGSSGVLRDELGVLPPGDVRQCLVALSDTHHLRDLFNYRFENGGLAGHSFGNLLLTALEKQTGSFAQAVQTASEVLNITGKVVPITLDNVRMVVDTTDGRRIEGEHTIDGSYLHLKPTVRLEPEGHLNPDAEEAIERADVVVIGPGDLYTSLAPGLIVPGMREALKRTNALVSFVCNLVVKPGHTEGMDVHDHAAEIERFIGAHVLDMVVYNTAIPPTHLVDKYRRDHEYLVERPRVGVYPDHYELRGVPLIASNGIEANIANSPADSLAATRSLIRHDPVLLRQAFAEIFSQQRQQQNTVA